MEKLFHIQTAFNIISVVTIPLQPFQRVLLARAVKDKTQRDIEVYEKREQAMTSRFERAIDQAAKLIVATTPHQESALVGLRKGGNTAFLSSRDLLRWRVRHPDSSPVEAKAASMDMSPRYQTNPPVFFREKKAVS